MSNEIVKQTNELSSQDWDLLIPYITSLVVAPCGSNIDEDGWHHVILDPKLTQVEIELTLPENLKLDWKIINELFWNAEIDFWMRDPSLLRKFKGNIKNDSLRVYILMAIADGTINMKDFWQKPFQPCSSENIKTNLLGGSRPCLPESGK